MEMVKQGWVSADKLGVVDAGTPIRRNPKRLWDRRDRTEQRFDWTGYERFLMWTGCAACEREDPHEHGGLISNGVQPDICNKVGDRILGVEPGETTRTMSVAELDFGALSDDELDAQYGKGSFVAEVVKWANAHAPKSANVPVPQGISSSLHLARALFFAKMRDEATVRADAVVMGAPTKPRLQYEGQDRLSGMRIGIATDDAPQRINATLSKMYDDPTYASCRAECVALADAAWGVLRVTDRTPILRHD